MPEQGAAPMPPQMEQQAAPMPPQTPSNPVAKPVSTYGYRFHWKRALFL